MYKISALLVPHPLTSMLSENMYIVRGSPLWPLLMSRSSTLHRNWRWDDSTVACTQIHIQYSTRNMVGILCMYMYMHMYNVIKIFLAVHPLHSHNTCNMYIDTLYTFTCTCILHTGQPSISLKTSNICICLSVFLLSSLIWLREWKRGRETGGWRVELRKQE